MRRFNENVPAQVVTILREAVLASTIMKPVFYF